MISNRKMTNRVFYLVLMKICGIFFKTAKYGGFYFYFLKNIMAKIIEVGLVFIRGILVVLFSVNSPISFGWNKKRIGTAISPS